jgi:hypothetical protein
MKLLPPEENIATGQREIEFDKQAITMGVHGARAGRRFLGRVRTCAKACPKSGTSPLLCAQDGFC